MAVTTGTGSPLSSRLVAPYGSFEPSEFSGRREPGWCYQMLTQDEARSRVLAELCRSFGAQSGPRELVIVDEATIERPWGWVFFYNTRAGRDGELGYTLVGNAPMIVNRFDASLRFTGTGDRIEHCIEEYETKLERQQGAWELVIKERPDSPLSVFSRLREVLGLSVTQVGDLRKQLPGVYRAGARADLAPILARLVGADISAELRRSTRAEQKPENVS